MTSAELSVRDGDVRMRDFWDKVVSPGTLRIDVSGRLPRLT